MSFGIAHMEYHPIPFGRAHMEYHPSSFGITNATGYSVWDIPNEIPNFE